MENEIKTIAPKKPQTWMYIVVVVLLILAVGIFFFGIEEPKDIVDEETTICIAEKSIMYGVDWCSYCKKQKAFFGENVKFLNIIDCDKNPQVCFDIGVEVYPTWVIEGKTYKGLQSVEKLKELTGC